MLKDRMLVGHAVFNDLKVREIIFFPPFSHSFFLFCDAIDLRNILYILCVAGRLSSSHTRAYKRATPNTTRASTG